MSERSRLSDVIVLEDHSYQATPEERSRWQNKWSMRVNKEGNQGPMSQRPDCRDAKHTCRRLYKEVERTYCGKTSKKDKNTAVIFKEHRTNQILRSNENR